MLSPTEDHCSDGHAWRWFALCAFVFAIQIGSLWYPTPDAINYLSIARSIANEHVLANHGCSHLYYSIGYPLLISPAFLLDERPFLFLSLIHFFWALVLLLGVYSWARRCAPDAALWITALTAVNTSVWNLYRRSLTEICFMAVLMLVVNIADRICRSETLWRRIGWIVSASSLVLLLALIRPVGIMVAAGFGFASARSAVAGRIGWAQAIAATLAIGVPASIALAAMLERDRIEAGRHRNVSYVQQIVDHETSPADQLIEGMRVQFTEIGRLLLPGMYKCYNRRGSWLNLNMAIYVPLCALICVGWLRMFRATNDVLVWTLPCYVAVYVIWPYEQGTRFVTPMLPVWLAALWFVLERLEPSLRRTLYALTLGAHFAVAMGYWLCDELRTAREVQTQWDEAALLSQPIQADWRPVLASDGTKDFRYPLEYLLDRPVRPLDMHDPIPDDVGWLVLLKEEEPPADFILHSESTRYRLFMRSTPAK